ncbi:uncharacterized protein Cp110 [Chelonus insularis]|uniref:uncharacterized protein Cp110 n=1 Tax=Chelonus insularis TaxID=460826 RepID=UPI00158BF3A7|nr:uncharacterized protein LOC118071290 [Chelonus insularis]
MDSYVSCIKIRGMPILPPLMTDNLRAEMKYYKQLALAVEEKLSRLELETNQKDEEEIDNSSSYEHETMSEKKSMTLSRQESLLSSGIESPDHLSKISNDKINFEVLENKSKVTSEDATFPKNTDVHIYSNTLDLSRTDALETISGIGKPQVPNSLNIIPITVETPTTNKKKSSSEIEESEEEAPKLIRQGSYTLETPSSMLLAYIEQSEYSSGLTSSINDEKVKEFNSIEIQPELRNLEKQKEFLIKKNNTNNANKRRSSISGNENKYRENNKAFETTDKQLVGEIHQVARSMDCIQTMLSKEYICGMTNFKRNCSNRRSKDNGHTVNKNNMCKTTDNASISHLPNKLGGSLGSLSYEKSPNKCDDNNRMTKSFETSFPDSYNKENVNKIKSITSDKLMYVFKEIQKTHQRQMADLMARQQREQIILQQEFEKQQLVLLEQLEKSFPGVSMPSIVNKYVRSPVYDNNQHKYSKNSVSLPKSRQNHSDGESSIFNGSSFESEGSISINCVSTRDTSFSEKVNSEKKKSSVSRQLFCEETQHHRNLIINGSAYNEKHIKAATIINAYARGYLVRRLMKTERVMTLKNTYKEALHCMLKLHVDAPWELPELNFHKRLQHQCDAASINIVELFAQSPANRMEIIFHDRQIKKCRQERPSSTRSTYSFATQRTLARKKFKELGIAQLPVAAKNNYSARTRCQTWTSNSREKRSPALINQGIKRSTSAGAVRKPWR